MEIETPTRNLQLMVWNINPGWTKKLLTITFVSRDLLAITVKFGTALAATFLNISAENYTNMWFKSNAIGVSFTHTDVTPWRIQSANGQESPRRHHRTSVNSAYYCQHGDGLLPDIDTSALRVNPAAGRRAVTHCQEHPDAYPRRRSLTGLCPSYSRPHVRRLNERDVLTS